MRRDRTYPTAIRALPRASSLRAAAFIALTAGAVAATLAMPRLAQDAAYHDFADHRALAGIPNAANVLSNVAFLAVGCVGLRVLGRGRATFLDARERTPWIVMFAGVLLTAGGSAAYHWDPANGSLVLDRLPMSIDFMALFAAMIAERLDPRFLPAGAEAFRRDDPDAEVIFYDTGHFALETHAVEIAAAIDDFLRRKLPEHTSGDRIGARARRVEPRRHRA
jgi:pimeloyl-ACP methyl ester carboxylesterase